MTWLQHACSKSDHRLYPHPHAPPPPHFTFHISSHLSGPLDRNQFIFLSPLFSYTHTSTHSFRQTNALFCCPCLISIASFSLNLDLICPSQFSLASSFFLPHPHLRDMSLQGITTPFFPPVPPSSIIWQLAEYQEGSRFLIPETCPATDTPLPLVGDQQHWVHQRSERSASPNYISALPHRGYTSEATRRCVWCTCKLTFLCAYTSAHWASHLFAAFWG